jgi:hypothetical protein
MKNVIVCATSGEADVAALRPTSVPLTARSQTLYEVELSAVFSRVWESSER